MIGAMNMQRAQISGMFFRARMFVHRMVCVTTLFFIVTTPSFAQPDASSAAPEGQLLVDVLPQFITTYRERSWVPVDVLVRNNKQDISGTIDITMFTGEDPRSPAYRLPVESPKGSVKRFRLYCNFSKATAMNVMLYNGRRAALPDPLRLTSRPIDKNDVLALVLDDEPADYGFVFNAVQEMSPGLGYHRESLRIGEMSQLPEFPQCFDAYTMIILGKFDPMEVPERQRELLLRYVEHGGVIVLCIGENAQRFKGTWVEQLAGVAIGDVAASNEAALAGDVFGPDLAQGARDDKSIVYARITPGSGAFIQSLGGSATNVVLATIRPIGSGHVATIAVDAAGKALHGTAGFIALWRNLIELREEAAEPNYEFASWQAANTLPSATGIRVYPRSSVLIYLGLYFAVGIVGNWIFWSLLKRREMAWVCLVFISFGFTAYALVYGTAGRAKATEISQLEVLRLPLESPTAKLRSTVGIVAARSSRYNLAFPNAYPLVSDIDSRSTMMGMPQNDSLMGRMNVFQFMQGPNAAVNNFSVGASEMRIVQVESEIATPGKIEGGLTWDAEGIHGELRNNTGLKVRNPFLLINGQQHRVDINDNTWRANIPNAALAARDRMQDVSNRYMMNFGYYGGGTMDVGQLKDQYLKDLFAAERNTAFIDERIGPYVCGWLDSTNPIKSVDLGEPAQERVFGTLLIADVSIDLAPGAGVRRIELDVDVPMGNRNQQFPPQYYGGDALSYSVNGPEPLPVLITIPRNYLSRTDATLVVDVYTLEQGNNAQAVFYPKDADENWAKEHGGESTAENQSGQNVRITAFTVADWASRVTEDTHQVEGIITVNQNGIRQGFARVDVRARLLIPQTQFYGGVWKPWQS
ncbi:MAG: hypothetical protein IT366_15885 [Candidatus Hydrogenedentes bacterium]|nr:hypothetical protein [Candidatus Hydrogenedentota bacterium]